MSLLKPLLRREIKSREDLVGTVVSEKFLKPYNTGSVAPMWVCDVNVGDEKLLRDVPIKGSAAQGNRFFADRGQTVLLRRNTLGRFHVIGPADRLNSVAGLNKYSIGATTPTTAAQLGFTINPVPFEFYEGPTSGTPGTSLWADSVTPFPLVQILDQDGNPV